MVVVVSICAGIAIGIVLSLVCCCLIVESYEAKRDRDEKHHTE